MRNHKPPFYLRVMKTHHALICQLAIVGLYLLLFENGEINERTITMGFCIYLITALFYLGVLLCQKWLINRHIARLNERDA